jgi:hypothetical protein
VRDAQIGRGAGDKFWVETESDPDLIVKFSAPYFCMESTLPHFLHLPPLWLLLSLLLLLFLLLLLVCVLL